MCFGCSRTYFRLGNHSPDSGLRDQVSRSALNFHVTAKTPAMTTPAMSVLALQFAGCAYQPPDGDHTCLGYLHRGHEHLSGEMCRRGYSRDFSSTALGHHQLANERWERRQTSTCHICMPAVGRARKLERVREGCLAVARLLQVNWKLSLLAGPSLSK